MPKIFTPQELRLYFTDRKEYHYCKKARERESEMRTHSDGIFPEKLINERRPNETLEVLEYRKKIFVAKTKPYFNKIENTLQKIRRSSDWSIKYPEDTANKIVEGEKIMDYCEKNYPVFGSLTNWAFGLLLRNYLIDANGLVMISPYELPGDETKFIEPVATVFNSCDVIDFVEDQYAVMRNRVGCFYYVNGVPKSGKSFYVVDDMTVLRYDQSDGRGNYTEAFSYAHNLGLLPVFKMGGITVDVFGVHSLYESRICGILPEFNEAIREYSDLQAAKVLHLFPERWEYTQNECVNCKGSGRRMDETQTPPCSVVCTTCAGAGYVATGPYSKMLIRPAAADQKDLPTPPAGFVEKDVEIIKVQEQSIKDHIYAALAAINFEFLVETPLNQSGLAKDVDKDELNNMVHSIAEDIVRILDQVYWLIGLYRYSEQYSQDDIYEMLPDISVPEKYDILSTKYFDEQITSAIKNKLNPAILNAMEVAYATKVFNNDLEIAEYVQMILKIDPLSGISEDDKMARLSNNGITQLDYVVSSNINKFVSEAIMADSSFTDKELSEQKEAIYKLAQAQIQSQTADIIPPDAGNDG